MMMMMMRFISSLMILWMIPINAFVHQFRRTTTTTTTTKYDTSIFLVGSSWQSRSVMTKHMNGPALQKKVHNGRISNHNNNISNRNYGTALSGTLWERMGLEEDEEFAWYMMNCIAGDELALRAQCERIAKDYEDIERVAVPTKKKIRSHGANRMVQETFVRYPGYVFVKVRMCEEAFSALMELDLCRSWMGVKPSGMGRKKLPAAPVALDDLEVEKYGLEEYEDEEEVPEVQDDGIVLDTEELDQVDAEIEEQVQQVYMGLRVDDMIKVTAKNKFFGEDGIVRRLKDGKIFVKFYTFGTMYDEWLDPNDVRKLSNIEILKGLSGPTKPVSQDDLERKDERDQSFRRGRNDVTNFGRGPRQRRQDQSLDRYSRQRDQRDDRGRERENWQWYQRNEERNDRGTFSGGNDWDVQRSNSNDRNFRQRRDDNFNPRRNNYDNYNRRDQQRNYNNNNNDNDRWGNQRQQRINNNRWGDDRQQQQQQQRGNNNRWGDDRQRQQQRGNNNRWDQATNRQSRQDRSRSSPRQQQQQQRQEKRPDFPGGDDWSTFVSPAPSSSSSAPPSQDETDEFFESLMGVLSSNLDSPDDGGGTTEKMPSIRGQKSSDDDFFDSLASELSTSASDDSQQSGTYDDDDSFFNSLKSEIHGGSKQRGENNSGRRQKPMSTANDDLDDFFSEFDTSSPADDSTRRGRGSAASTESDDFFAGLEAELDTELSSKSWSRPYDDDDRNDKNHHDDGGADEYSAASVVDDSTGYTEDVDDFFAGLEAELGADLSSDEIDMMNVKDLSSELYSEPQMEHRDNDNDRNSDGTINKDMFADLEAELGPELSTKKDVAVESSSFESIDASSFESIDAPDPVDITVEKTETAKSSSHGGDGRKSSSTSSSSPSTSSSSSSSTVDLQKCTVPVLKDMLREKGLKVSGKKAELIERLIAN